MCTTGHDDAPLRDLLRRDGLPTGDLGEVPSSPKRFRDGAQYRLEVPSTEGPACLRAVLEEAADRDITVHRVSQGSGVLMHTDNELADMARIAADAGVEVSLFARANASWSTSAMARSPHGGALGPLAWGQDQVVQALNDARRASEHGFRSVLITDIGVLASFDALRRQGGLPADMQAKISVMMPVANPSAARVVEDLGANTLNIPTDLTLGQMAAIRATIDIPIDVYVEAPDVLGGFVRHGEIAEIVRVAAPVYLKFGLRNAADVYPAGIHLAAHAASLSRERVRRARLGLDMLQCSGSTFTMSPLPAQGQAVPKI